MRAHGTRACYIHGPERGSRPGGCRCVPCRTANTAYENGRARAKVYGRWDPWAPAELVDETIEHVRALTAAGVGTRAIGSASGVGHTRTTDIGLGRVRKMRESTCRRILAVTASARSGGARVRSDETWRLLEELIAAGMTRRRIARCLGIGDSIQIPRTTCTERNARAVRELHDGLWPIWPALRAECRCFAAITNERRREANRNAKRRERAEEIA